MSIDASRVREFARLQMEKRRLQERIGDIDERCKSLKPKILEEFASEGTNGFRVTGVGGVYLHRQGWARIVKDDPERREVLPHERKRAIEALERAGLGEFVTENFNTQSVSAHFRELSREGEDLPPELEGVLEFEESFDLRVRKA